MKKILSLLMVSVICLMKAAPATSFVALVSDSVFYNGAHAQTLNTGTSGNYSHWYLYKKNTDTTMYHSDTLVGSGTVLIHYIKKLQPNTSYSVWSVIKNGSFIDTSNASITLTTKGVPTTPSMSVVNIIGGIDTTRIIFSYSTQIPTIFYDLHQGFLSSGDSVYKVMGSGVDTLVFKTNSCTTYTGNALIAETVEDTFPPTFINITNWTTACYQKAVVINVTLTPSIDSVIVRSNVTVYQGLTTQVLVSLYDSSKNFLTSLPVQSISITSLMAKVLNNLTPDKFYWVKVTATNAGGIDSFWQSTRTLKVPSPTPNRISSTKTKTSYAVRFKVTTNGPWAGSVVNKIYLTDALGTDSMSVAISDTATLTFTKTGRAAGTIYPWTLTVKNVAGLTGTLSGVDTTLSPYPVVAPTFASLMSNSPSEIIMYDIRWNVASGDRVYVQAVCEDMQSGWSDTATIVSGATMAGVVPSYIWTNRRGGANYCVHLIIFNDDGQRAASAVLCNPTVTATDPVLFDIVQNVAIDNTKLSIQIIGDNGGTVSTLYINLYDIYNQQVGTTFLDTNPGTGNINYPYLFTGLLPGTYYKVQAKMVPLNGGAQSIIQEVFKTSGYATGIEDVSDVFTPQAYVSVSDIVGRVLVENIMVSEVGEKFPNQQIILTKKDSVSSFSKMFYFIK